MIKLPLYTPDEERNLKSLVYALTQCVSKDKQECGINELIRPAEDEETVQTNEWLEKLFRDLYLFNAPYNLVAASEIVLSATKNNWVCKLTRDEEKFRTSIDDFVGNVRERHLQTMLDMQKISSENRKFSESIFEHSFHPICHMTRNGERAEDEAYVILIGIKKEEYPVASWDKIGIIRRNNSLNICLGDDLYNKPKNESGNPRSEIEEFLKQ